jgi:hypothetical protein
MFILGKERDAAVSLFFDQRTTNKEQRTSIFSNLPLHFVKLSATP